jgi:hypothetical protein
MQTLLLDQSSWDLLLDADGNVAVASDPYSIAQDAASAIRLIQGELWYDTTQGIPYFDAILGYRPPTSLIKAKFAAAALTVPGVVSAQVFVTGISGRRISGQVQVTTSTGQTVAASFS